MAYVLNQLPPAMRYPVVNRWQRILAVQLALWLMLCLGCSTEPTEQNQTLVEAEPVAFQSPLPRRYLASVFARYRNAVSYHDDGKVRLMYRVDGREETKVAPMQIWLDRGQLYVEAYDVRMWSDEQAFVGWVQDPTTEDFDSQVLQLPPSRGRPELSTIFADPILTQRVSAGLAGPPPQLDWLFAPEAMKQLFESEFQFSFGRSGNLSGRQCRNVTVKAGEEVYQFWIDERDAVIRRVDLPPIVAPPQPGQPPQAMTLSLDLQNASFAAPQREPDIKPLPSAPKYVRQLIPLPPAEPPRSLGKRTNSFRLTTQGFAVSQTGGDRDAVVLMRFAGDQTSMVSLATLEQWHNNMPGKLRDQVRIIVAVDAAAKSRMPNELQTPTAIDEQQQASRALQLGPGGLAILDSSGRVAWVQEAIVPPTMVTLGAVLADVLNDVDVPARIRQQWNEQIRGYQQAIQQVAIGR